MLNKTKTRLGQGIIIVSMLYTGASVAGQCAGTLDKSKYLWQNDPSIELREMNDLLDEVEQSLMTLSRENLESLFTTLGLVKSGLYSFRNAGEFLGTEPYQYGLYTAVRYISGRYEAIMDAVAGLFAELNIEVDIGLNEAVECFCTEGKEGLCDKLSKLRPKLDYLNNMARFCDKDVSYFVDTYEVIINGIATDLIKKLNELYNPENGVISEDDKTKVLAMLEILGENQQHMSDLNRLSLESVLQQLFQ